MNVFVCVQLMVAKRNKVSIVNLLLAIASEQRFMGHLWEGLAIAFPFMGGTFSVKMSQNILVDLILQK